MSHHPPFHLFDCFGVELEYMIINRQTLDIAPIADRLLTSVDDGRLLKSHNWEIDRGEIAWSNELVAHVLEIKGSAPVQSLIELEQPLLDNITDANRLLAEWDAMLLPTAMHPWMNPYGEMTLWPHEGKRYYEAFNRIFDCRGHGWANLQSVHLNLPFHGDDEFRRLHSAIRVLLPLLPALAASSPMMEGKLTRLMDNRLEVYRHNCKRIPSITGRVVPELVRSIEEYHDLILAPMYRDIEPHDPDGVLQEEWLNARGAVAKFERNAIEIRVLDVQETPKADLAVCALIVSVLKSLISEQFSSLAMQESLATEELEQILLATIEDADAAMVHNGAYLKLLGIETKAPMRAGDIWRRLVDTSFANESELATWNKTIDALLREGPLARRILHSLDLNNLRPSAEAIYRELAACLDQGEMFSTISAAGSPPSELAKSRRLR